MSDEPIRDVLSILHTEDEEIDRVEMERVLRVAYPDSHRETVAYLEQAKARLSVRDVDLMLVDLNLRDAKGLQALVEIRPLTDAIIIVVTGFADEQQFSDCIRAKANWCIGKDEAITPNRIRRIVSQCQTYKVLSKERLFTEADRTMVTELKDRAKASFERSQLVLATMLREHGKQK